MSLGLVIERMSEHLGAGLATPLPRIGGATPTASNELPALVLSVVEGTEVRAGIGDTPGPANPPSTRIRRPVAVTSRISLADPVLHSPDGDIALFSDGGRVLRLPHGGLVHADGTAPPPPLTAADLSLRLDDTPLVLVSGAPDAGEFQLDDAAAAALGYADAAASGVVRFAAPLTGTTLEARYFLGEYDLSVVRYRGQMAIDVIAANATAVTNLSNAVGALLRRGPLPQQSVAYRLAATSWGPIGAPETALNNARRRSISVSFDLELADVRLHSGGGVIARIDVQTNLDDGGVPPLPADSDISVTS